MMNRPLMRVSLLLVACAVAGCSSPRAMQPEPAPVAPAQPQARVVDGWNILFDGTSLDGWTVLTEGPFQGNGAVTIRDGAMMLARGNRQTGVSWKGAFPLDNYEVLLQAQRVEGSDFFCGMTFPVGEEPCTLIVGGWGGNVVGLSNVDHQHAAENITTTGMSFESERWYRIRLRVTPGRISAWIDEEHVIDLERDRHSFSVWYEQEPVRPFGISTWDTGAALKDIRVRELGGEAPE